jgi:hypothetical protein
MLLSVGIGTACCGYCLIVFSVQVTFYHDEKKSYSFQSLAIQML